MNQLIALLQELSAVYCELVSLSSLYSPTAQQSQPAPHAHSVLTANVSAYIIQFLSDPTRSTTRSSTDTYTSLLPTIWSLLNQASSETSAQALHGELFSALLSHFASCGPTSTIKSSSFEFICNLVLVSWKFSIRLSISCWSQLDAAKGYIGHFKSGSLPQALRAKLDQWGLSLPKYLWEIGSNRPDLTEVRISLSILVGATDGDLQSILAFIHDAARLIRSNETWLSQPKFADTLASFFHLHHPQRGDIAGPYARLPQVQALARHMVLFLAWHQPLLDSRLQNAMESATASARVAALTA